MRKLSLLLAFLPILGSVTAEGATACLSRSEARQVWPRAYLYWSGGPKGQRCWSNKRGKRVWIVPAKVMAAVPPMPSEPVHIEPVLQWQPQWSWVFSEIYQREIDEPFTTFPPGTEPDVWPVLAQPAANHGELLMVLASGMVALIFGIMFVRWHSRRIRLTRGPDDYGTTRLSGHSYR